MKLQEISLYRSSSSRSSRKVVPSNYTTRPSSPFQYNSIQVLNKPLVQKYRVISLAWWYKTQNVLVLMRSLIGFLPFSSQVPTGSWLITKPSKRLIKRQVGNVTGTLFGYKNGHVSFAVQDDGRSGPVLLLELVTFTGTLVQEMSSGQLRITLECAKRSGAGQYLNLLQEPAWTMYCNGKKCGHAISRSCAERDWFLLSNIQNLTADAGVIPINKSLTTTGMDGELAYMRSRFERVIGNHNSEAFYMLSPDGTGGPELSIHLLRI
ncbi:hypothetical protein AQUCO_00900344v1 [Aquilegia coerulea]|uniref:Protein MIZU-KUSSEI 1 n=1 Tax=Aquilegia coerulea TaxID=218851 RepID=A0A2G5ED55_AQUCA|nr:hypothetical protein AQUCO_00900344v1 [Aquilegia coerulea]